ncbi:MAG: nickel-dependent hydrogenase large subunit, partial [Elusimicrobiales bacterium]|nr:nickel-dependent hydrogenase large subunit [Elusimicrobiales bacterium]
RMKKMVNDVCDILVGRHTHPISLIVGGFTKLPKPKDLKAMLDTLKAMEGDMAETLALIKTLKLPDFTRETEFVALVSNDDEYPMLNGDIGSTDGKRFPKEDYKKATNEFVDSRSSAKFTKLSRESLMVGSLARFNLNYDKLCPNAKKVAEDLGLKPVCYNPYMNTIAQVVEIVHCYEHAIAILEDLIKTGIDYCEEVVVGVNEKNVIPVKAGKGSGAVEVPRGILFHEYQIDDKGIIEHADCVIPTNQNINNIEHDMAKLLPEILDKSKEEITLLFEMLVRAYDPCISCSAHYLDVKFTD